MKLVITEPKDFSSEAIDLLKSKYEVITLKNTELLNSVIDDADVLFVRLGIILNQNLLEKAKKLKFICSPTTGLDHVDINYCQKANIQILSLKGEVEFLGSIPSTAEHTWTLLTAVNRKLNLAQNDVNLKHWNRNKFKTYNLKDKTLGILGLGRVGKQVAKYALAFGMKVISYDTDEEQSFEKVESLDHPTDLFSSSDFVSIHIPLNENNLNFVDASLINQMKSNACIINTSRGRVWDESSVAQALLSGQIRGVATDVVYDEVSSSIFESPIFNIDTTKYNCIITPHIAGATFDSMAMTEIFIAQKLLKNV
ncbi:MAG: NAD(P)-dependent oxidoreductase [Psychroflexus salarius]